MAPYGRCASSHVADDTGCHRGSQAMPLRFDGFRLEFSLQPIGWYSDYATFAIASPQEMRYSPAALSGFSRPKFFDKKQIAIGKLQLAKPKPATLCRCSQHGVEWG